MSDNTKPQAPKISILVAAWNEEENVDRFVQSYLSLPYPNKEMILCAGGDDRTYQKASQYVDNSLILLQQEPGEGKQRALRRAFPYASGDIVMLTDADCLLDQISLQTLLEPIIRGEEKVTNGSCRPKASQLSHPFVIAQYAGQQQGEPALDREKYLPALLGRNCAMLRTVLEEVGAFNEDVSIGTDSFLAKKIVAAGHRIRYVTASAVETDYHMDLWKYARQRSRWLRNAILYNLRFKLYRRFLHAWLPVGLGVAMLTLPLFSLTMWPLFSLWVLLVGYAYRKRLQAVRALQEQQIQIPRSLYWQLPLYMFADWYAGILTIYHLLFSGLRGRW